MSRWKAASDLDRPEIQRGDPVVWEAANLLNAVWAGELKELAADYPERGAVLVAEMLRRGSAEFAGAADVEVALLAVASRRRDLAEHLWEIMREQLAGQPDFDDIVQNLMEAVESLAERRVGVRPEDYIEPSWPLGRLDRAAITLFYVDCIAASSDDE